MCVVWRRLEDRKYSIRTSWFLQGPQRREDLSARLRACVGLGRRLSGHAEAPSLRDSTILVATSKQHKRRERDRSLEGLPAAAAPCLWVPRPRGGGHGRRGPSAASETREPQRQQLGQHGPCRVEHQVPERLTQGWRVRHKALSGSSGTDAGSRRATAWLEGGVLCVLVVGRHAHLLVCRGISSVGCRHMTYRVFGRKR